MQVFEVAKTTKNSDLIKILKSIDLGSDIAEEDNLLESTRIETSVYSDLLRDHVDLIPGTKGSGKSALYRIFTEFLPEILLEQKKVAIAHGVSHHGDSVFHAFKNEFEKLTEDAFVDFWCIYFVSLANKEFLKNPIYEAYIQNSEDEIKNFCKACEAARIPEVEREKSLKDILAWGLNALKKVHPKVRYTSPDVGTFDIDLFGDPVKKEEKNPTNSGSEIIYGGDIKVALEKILKKSDLTLWLFVDRLDEIFPRRSELEKRALRGLLRTTRFFSSPEIRIKIFLRDDMLLNIIGKEGFTALSHVTSRQSDTLKWEENQMLDLLLKRLVASQLLKEYLNLNEERFEASAEYRQKIFYRIFPKTIYKGERQSNTMKWIYTHLADGNNVVTPRDVIYLITRAKQRQQDLFMANSEGESEYLISAQAILYGYEELSKRKQESFLKAEFPHLWGDIEKLVGGKTEYSAKALKSLLGKKWDSISDDLVSIGLLSKNKNKYKVPFLYRKGLEVTRGSV